MDDCAIVTSFDMRGPVPVKRNERILKFLYKMGLKWANGEDTKLIHVKDFRILYIQGNRITFTDIIETRLLRDLPIADMSRISNEE